MHALKDEAPIVVLEGEDAFASQDVRTFDLHEVLDPRSSNPRYVHQDDTYIHIDWGPSVDAQHLATYPDVERPAQLASIGGLALQLVLANGGACFVPERLSAPYVSAGRLHVALNTSRFRLPTYVVYPLERKSADLEQALVILRTMAATLACGPEAAPERPPSSAPAPISSQRLK